MKLAKTTLLLGFLVAMCIGTPYTLANFTDINDLEPAYQSSIEWMVNSDILHGNDDGTLRPKNCIKRAEYSKLLVNILGLEFEEETNLFKDTPENEWYIPYIKTLKKRGTIQGYPDGNFKPGKCVTRGEAIKMATLEFNNGEIPNSKLDYGSIKEMTKDNWYYDYVDYAISTNQVGLAHLDQNRNSYNVEETTNSYKLIESFGELNYQPNSSMSREEVIEMLVRMKVTKDNNLNVYNRDSFEYINEKPTTSRDIAKLTDLKEQKNLALKKLDSEELETNWESCKSETLLLDISFPNYNWFCDPRATTIDIYLDTDESLYFNLSEAGETDETIRYLTSMEMVRKVYEPKWKGLQAKETEINLDGIKAYKITYPENVLQEIYIPLNFKVIQIKSNILDTEIGNKILNSIQFNDIEFHNIESTEVSSSVNKYKDNLVHLPYGEIERIGLEKESELAQNNLKGAKLIFNTDPDTMISYITLSNKLAKETKSLPEDIRVIYYYKDQPETLFAQIANKPTHTTDYRNEDDYDIDWNNIPPIEETTGGLYRSIDNGNTWKRIWMGYSPVSSGVCPSNSNIMYTLNTERHGGGSGEAYAALYTSKDAGDTWNKINLKSKNETEVELHGKEGLIYMTWVGYKNVLYPSQKNCNELVLGGLEEFGLAYYIDLETETINFIKSFN